MWFICFLISSCGNWVIQVVMVGIHYFAAWLGWLHLSNLDGYGFPIENLGR